jgi:hypothetical protein
MSSALDIDRQLEDLFDGELRRNPPRRLWPLISGKLGEQLSSRPWEWAIHQMDRSGLALRPSHFYAAGAAILIMMLVVAYVVLINTGELGEGVVTPGQKAEQPVPTTTPGSTIVAETSRWDGSYPWPTQSLPSIELSEQESASETWVYLTVFQNGPY